MAKKFNFSDAEQTPIGQSATETMAGAYEKKSNNEQTVVSPSIPQVAPTKNATPMVMDRIEQIAQRRMQIQSEYNNADIQALSLKTFPEAGNYYLEQIVRQFNLNRQPGTPKMTKSALAEMLLLDAVIELYGKMCGR